MSFFALDLKSALMLVKGGELSSWDEGEVVLGDKLKRKYWEERGMLGIMAKLAKNHLPGSFNRMRTWKGSGGSAGDEVCC